MLRKFLFRLTGRLPCRLIHRDGNQRYLERYYVGRLFGVTAYLHRFVARDADEWVHDHPWRWSLAICLAGGYTEERLRWWEPTDRGWHAVLRKIFPGRPNLIRASDFHRIVQTQPETWTLFLHGRRIKSWGFLQRRMGLITSPELVYRQPYNVSASSGWEHRAVRGDAAGRAPFHGRVAS